MTAQTESGVTGRLGRPAAFGAALAARRWQVAGVAAALVVVALGKTYYRDASAGDLGWILAPTAHLVSWVTGVAFTFERGAGWISREVGFIIAPACAGVNFALAAFLALSLGWLPGMRSARSTAARLALAAAVAYVATLVVNTARIAIAIAMHRGTIDVGGWDREHVHEVEGIVVYLGGLCALYALARAVEARRRPDAPAR